MITKNYTDRLTIAIPVFERTEFFEEAISSALGQLIKCPVIVVDNASSHSYFKDYCQAHQITYFRNDYNIGMFANWNKCIELADTEYVLILGDDDIVSENYSTRFLQALNLFPELDIYYSDFIILISKTLTKVNHRHIFPFGYSPNGKQVIENAIQFGLGFPVITSAIKKKIFSGFYTAFHASNDWVWLYSSVHAFSCFGDNEKLLQYRSHEKQDHSQLHTRINCIVSIAYLYGEVLGKFVHQKSLLRLTRRRERNALLYLLSIASSTYITDLLRSQHLYGIYFVKKTKSNKFFYLFSKLPMVARNIMYRGLRRIRIIEGI